MEHVTDGGGMETFLGKRMLQRLTDYCGVAELNPAETAAIWIAERLDAEEKALRGREAGPVPRRPPSGSPVSVLRDWYDKAVSADMSKLTNEERSKLSTDLSTVGFLIHYGVAG